MPFPVSVTVSTRLVELGIGLKLWSILGHMSLLMPALHPFVVAKSSNNFGWGKAEIPLPGGG